MIDDDDDDYEDDDYGDHDENNIKSEDDIRLTIATYYLSGKFAFYSPLVSISILIPVYHINSHKLSVILTL